MPDDVWNACNLCGADPCRCGVKAGSGEARSEHGVPRASAPPPGESVEGVVVIDGTRLDKPGLVFVPATWRGTRVRVTRIEEGE